MLAPFVIILFLLKLAQVFGLDTEVVVLRAVRGREARLPCGQGRVFLDGPDSYVLWLKNDRDLLYRFPNEDSVLRTERVFPSNCEGDSCYDETALLLKRVSEQDGGMYRCRVHYQASPSVDYVIDVRLVDSPGTPKIYDENGAEIKKGYVGPYSLGSDLAMTCEVNDDQSDTLVYWRRNGVVIERAHTSRPGVLAADVRIRNMTRDELDAHYECLAQNADVTAPLSASVVIKMYLPPLTVEIRMNNNPDFEAGQPRVIDCVVVGCVPPPSIIWHLGDNLLRPSVHKELHDGNYTVSSLTLAPSVRDSGRKLSCKAHNSLLPLENFEHAVTVNVGYRPLCKSGREETVGTSEKQVETVTCVVEASPEPMQVSWTFADSRTLYTSVQKVPGHHNRYTSTLTWVPRSSDIGVLQCRATNAFGEQKQPCSYTVTPGGPPRTPDCVMLRSYPDSLRVQCKKGWDGGRPQIVHLEIFDSNGDLLQNVSSSAGHFHLQHIAEDHNLTAIVYASSVRGKSQPTTMHLQTITPLIASAVATENNKSRWRWAELITSIVVVIVAAVGVSVCVCACRSRNLSREDPDLVPRPDGSFHREPDFAREERVLGTTNITVNQLASCPNQYSSSPVPCRVMVGCGHTPTAEPQCSTQQSYYV